MGFISSKTLRRISHHHSSHGGHVRSVHHVAAHPHYSPRHLGSASHGHTHSSTHVSTTGRHVTPSRGSSSRGVSRSTIRHSSFRGLNSNQRHALTAFAIYAAQHGYSRKVTRALFTALGTHGSGYNWIVNAVAAQGRHHDRAFLKAAGFLKRAGQLEHKYGDPAMLAAAVGGRAPVQRYQKTVPLAKLQLHEAILPWFRSNVKPHLKDFRYTGGYHGQKAVFAAAGRKYGIDPRVLWSIYRVETAYGTNLSNSGVGPAGGAKGPMQFEDATARQYGVNVKSLKSSVYGAAHLLRDAGAPKDYNRAVLAYNHSQAYASNVLSKAGLAAFGKGGRGKKVRVKHSGGPYRQTRQFYAAKRRPPKVPGTSAPSGSSGAPRSSGTARSAVGVRGASAAPASSPSQVAQQATQLASSIIAAQQTPAIQPTLPSAPAAINAQSYLPLPSAFVDQGTGLSAPSLGAVHVRGLGIGRRSLSSYLRGR